MKSEEHTPRPVRVEFKVNVERAEALAVGTYEAVNLSSGGMCLRSSTPEHVGGFVAIRFAIGGEDLQLYSEIIWCKPEEDGGDRAGFRVGLRFVVIGAREKRLITEYVSSRDDDDAD